MHGADRIGGLSTANGLVFGTIAGESASIYSSNNMMSNIDEIEFQPYGIENVDEFLDDLQEIMFKSAMIEKTKLQFKMLLEKLII